MARRMGQACKSGNQMLYAMLDSHTLGCVLSFTGKAPTIKFWKSRTLKGIKTSGIKVPGYPDQSHERYINSVPKPATRADGPLLTGPMYSNPNCSATRLACIWPPGISAANWFT